jgi:hypothetical protein
VHDFKDIGRDFKDSPEYLLIVLYHWNKVNYVKKVEAIMGKFMKNVIPLIDKLLDFMKSDFMLSFCL